MVLELHSRIYFLGFLEFPFLQLTPLPTEQQADTQLCDSPHTQEPVASWGNGPFVAVLQPCAVWLMAEV